jgi:hypothetical protein
MSEPSDRSWDNAAKAHLDPFRCCNPFARRCPAGLIAAESAYAARSRGNPTRRRWARGTSSTALRIA